MLTENEKQGRRWGTISDEEWDNLKNNIMSLEEDEEAVPKRYAMLYVAAVRKRANEWFIYRYDNDKVRENPGIRPRLEDYINDWYSVEINRRVEVLCVLLVDFNDKLNQYESTGNENLFLYNFFSIIDPFENKGSCASEYQLIPRYRLFLDDDVSSDKESVSARTGGGGDRKRNIGIFHKSIDCFYERVPVDYLVIMVEMHNPLDVVILHSPFMRLIFDEEDTRDYLLQNNYLDDKRGLLSPETSLLLASTSEQIKIKDADNFFYPELDAINDEKKIKNDFLKLIALCEEREIDILLLPEMVMAPSSIDLLKDVLMSREGFHPILTVAGSGHHKNEGLKVNESPVLSSRGKELWVHRKVDPVTIPAPKGSKKTHDGLLYENITRGNLIQFVDLPGLGHRMLNLICKDFLWIDRLFKQQDSILPTLVTVPAYSAKLVPFYNELRIFYEKYRISSLICNAAGSYDKNKEESDPNYGAMVEYSAVGAALVCSAREEYGRAVIHFINPSDSTLDYFSKIFLVKV